MKGSMKMARRSTLFLNLEKQLGELRVNARASVVTSNLYSIWGCHVYFKAIPNLNTFE